uniref:DNA2/NAM7 helicase helicase domain-containing protein n=1 Tax=Chromera velia CCMP2878 TaxID=1169474 RepID=A0A0G4HPX7_9ALVE|eukprot:Cvel_7855.t1-p1 / transcript=Cvel_7855.t1 / gene=Cvel_7855 / organism=Chromera_velia_CCMP2878 / gene_product=ATP-dependent helicase upf1, putative / transcript_product=ATP-dependent helicase upf1, putative / location=Cvel_scaffold420:67202-69785(+) / protein_length=405 / sequence_SO=supercontig / SO=protein_coding / is_pseudo=false
MFPEHPMARLMAADGETAACVSRAFRPLYRLPCFAPSETSKGDSVSQSETTPFDPQVVESVSLHDHAQPAKSPVASCLSTGMPGLFGALPQTVSSSGNDTGGCTAMSEGMGRWRVPSRRRAELKAMGGGSLQSREDPPGIFGGGVFEFQTRPESVRLSEGGGWVDASLIPGIQECLSNLTLRPDIPLREAQKLAVRWSQVCRLTLVQGRRGTGKTHTAVGVVLNWVSRPRTPGAKVLGVAEREETADLLFQRLRERGVRAVRVGTGNRGSQQGQPEMESLKHDPQYAKLLQLKKEGARKESEASKLEMQMLKSAVEHSPVVVTTCTSACHEALQAFAFTRVVVDEAASMNEPAVTAPLSRGQSSWFSSETSLVEDLTGRETEADPQREDWRLLELWTSRIPSWNA